jgi:RNase P subunit RPR2
MDSEEANIIIDILKTGSRLYKPPAFECYEDNVEGIFIEYKPDADVFLLRRFEKDDWTMHNYGYDLKMTVTEDKLLDMFTGKMSTGSEWWQLTESNKYTFDFEKTKKLVKTVSMKILETMDIRDYSSLICSYCKSKNVDPLHYSSSVNIGGANRYVSLKVHCRDCGKDSDYSWDD